MFSKPYQITMLALTYSLLWHLRSSVAAEAMLGPLLDFAFLSTDTSEAHKE